MADTSPLAGLLDRAGKVFLLAWRLGRTFQQERGTEDGVRQIDPEGWDRHEPAFNEFCAAVLDLRDTMQNPPEGFAPVAQSLLKAAGVAKQIRDAMRMADGRAWASFLDFFPELNSVAASGREAIKEVTKARRLHDPFAFVDQPAKGKNTGIDTTPTLPKPPSGLIESAARAIPNILANVQPKHGAIELVASHLAKRLQDDKHTLAAAEWAIHQAVQAGRLRAGLIEDTLPSFERQVGRRGMFGMPDTRRGEWAGGERVTIVIPKGKPAPFNKFKVTATESLWEWWRSLNTVPEDETSTGDYASKNLHEAESVVTPTKSAATSAKRSTERGEGQAKLIAALTKHHKYADGSCLNLEPIGNNELARLAKVGKRTASAFFKKEFQGHVKYKAVCSDAGQLLVTALKLLNGEFAAHILYGNKPPEKAVREDDDE